MAKLTPEELKRDEIVSTLRAVMSVINSLPCSSEEFLGTDLYLEVHSALDGATYVDSCGECGEFVTEPTDDETGMCPACLARLGEDFDG